MVRGRIAHWTALTAASGSSLLLALYAGAPAALAGELKVMSTVALSATLDDLKLKFESASGHKVTIVYSVIADLKKRIQDGEKADVMLLSRAALDDLQTQGKVASGSIGTSPVPRWRSRRASGRPSPTSARVTL